MNDEDGYPSKAAFSLAVKAYLAEGRSRRVMADQFECAVSTIDRWANQTVSPGKNVRKAVVEWIRATA